jgi:DNA-nicking Smr family endonuclease
VKKKPAVETPKSPKKDKKDESTFRPFGAIAALKDMQKELKAKDEQAPQKPRPPVPKPTAKALPEDEALALYRMMNGVTPLKDRGATRVPKSQAEAPRGNLAAQRAAAEAPVRAQEEDVHAQLRALVEGGRFEVEDDGKRVEGRRQGVTPDVARKLRRGTYPIDARLDLHGETVESARKALEAFLKAKRAKGERCVLVIHGKGEHSPRGQGILRGEMAAWLSQGGASPHVAAFATATETDGGEGAVYVLLTR